MCTTTAQIAAAELGVRVEDVDVIDRIDTEVTPWTITTGSYASRFSIVVAAAVHRAAVKLNAQIRAIAAHALDTSPDTARTCGRRRAFQGTLEPLVVAAPGGRHGAMEPRRISSSCRHSACM